MSKRAIRFPNKLFSYPKPKIKATNTSHTVLFAYPLKPHEMALLALSTLSLAPIFNATHNTNALNATKPGGTGSKISPIIMPMKIQK